MSNGIQRANRREAWQSLCRYFSEKASGDTQAPLSLIKSYIQSESGLTPQAVGGYMKYFGSNGMVEISGDTVYLTKEVASVFKLTGMLPGYAAARKK